MSENIPYIIAEDGYYYVAYKEKAPVPEIVVSSKGIANGLSEEYNDGWDFGPDSYSSTSTSAIPYTQTAGIQEAGDYAGKFGGDIKINAGIFIINTPITFTASLHIIGSGKWFPFGDGSMPDTDIPGNVTIIRASSTFSGNYMIEFYNSGALLENFTIDLNNVAANGIYGYSSSTYPLPSQQLGLVLENVLGINGSSGYYYVVVENVWNTIIDKCTWNGTSGSVNLNNPGSDNWVLNTQDYTAGGMKSYGSYTYIFGGIQQLVQLVGGSAWIEFGNWTNNYTDTDIQLLGNMSGLYITNSLMYLESGYVIDFGGYSVDVLSLINTQLNNNYNYSSVTIFSSLSAYKKFVSLNNILVIPNTTLPTLNGNPFSVTEGFDGYHYLLSYAQPTAPSVPASGTAQQNTSPYPVKVYINGGALTEIQITIGGTAYTVYSNSTASAVYEGFTLPVGASITLTYTTAPTWSWVPE